ncbi:MAG: pilus assembly protein PilM, partial [Deltaproteobacteria bacterium]
LDKREDGSSLSLCIAAQSAKVSDYLALLQSAKVDPRYLPADVIQLFSLYQNFLKADASKAEAPKEASTEASTFILPTPGGPPDARLVVDIGHERTLVCACGEDGIAYTRVIRAGGSDVTQAIAQAYELEWEDAEDGKHEDALVASARHPAPSDAAARMSEVVASGLRPLVKELRRTLQAIRSEKRVRVARIDLIGGGARIRNLANYLAEQLNVPVANGVAVEQIVERNVEGPRRPAYALALANAIRTTAEDSATRMDLRVGEFAFAGTLENVRRRVPFIAGAIAVCSVLTLVNVFAQYHTVSAREAEIDQEFCSITKKVVGREICEPTVAISVVREPASELGAFKLPERSAYAVVAELSSLTPKDVDVTFEEMEVTPDRVRISGATVSFDAVDKLVSAYSANSCYSDIKKGKLSKKGDGAGVDFQLSIKLRCS